MALTEKQLQNLKPREGVDRYRVCDGRGLYIVVMASGRKFWSARVTKGGKTRWVSLGEYPEVSLKDAREKRYTLTQKAKDRRVYFGEIAEAWYTDRYAPTVGKRTANGTRSLLDRFILPELGGMNVAEIEPQDVYRLCRKIQGDSIHTGMRVRGVISRIFQHAIAAGVCKWDPASQVAGALLPPPPENHYAVVKTAEEARVILRSIDGMRKNDIVRLGLLLLAYTFVRPDEMRLARWSEIDFVAGVWEIPAERMKMKRPHTVPLSPQAVRLFQKLRFITGHRELCFFSPLWGKVISRPRFPEAMRKLGLKEGWKMTPHGFRGMASTLLNEHGFPPDVIERQLAHVESNAVRAAYNQAEYMEERRRMMNWWGDYLEKLMKD